VFQFHRRNAAIPSPRKERERDEGTIPALDFGILRHIGGKMLYLFQGRRLLFPPGGRYFSYLKEAKRQSEGTVDSVANRVKKGNFDEMWGE